MELADRDDGRDALRWINRLVARHLLMESLGRLPMEAEIENRVREGPPFRNLGDLYTVLEGLSEREAGILRLRSGLTGEPVRSAMETASVYGLTSTRISQIEKRLAAKLATYGCSGVPFEAAGQIVDPQDDYR